MATCWKFLKKNLDIFEKKIQILYLTKNWTFLSTIVDVFPRSILSENGQAASWREFYESAKHLGKAHLLQGKYHCTADLLFVFSCFAYVEKTTGLLVLCKLKPVKLKASDTSPPPGMVSVVFCIYVWMVPATAGDCRDLFQLVSFFKKAINKIWRKKWNIENFFICLSLFCILS